MAQFAQGKGHFPSTRHFVTPDRSHAALTELAFDTVWSEISARSQSGESQILQQVRSISDCKPLEKLAAYWLRQKRFDFATQYGIPLGQIVAIPDKCSVSHAQIRLILHKQFRPS